MGATVMRLGDATVGFDLPDRMTRAIAEAFSHIDVERAREPARASYRQTTDGEAIERHDPLRSGEPVTIGVNVEAVIDDLHLTLALHAVNVVYIHAGVVAIDSGAIVLPGRSRAGKSTLVHALLESGATYLSDEYACVTTEGQIKPYARSIHLRTRTGRRQIDPTTIGAVADHPVPPALLLFTQYERDATFAPCALGPAQAALQLFNHTVIAQVAPDRAIRAARQLAQEAPAFETNRPDTSAAASAVLDLARRIGKKEGQP